MDKLIIHSLELWVKVGCTAEERAFPQRLEMDVEMEMPLRTAGLRDDIRKTVDYAEVVSQLKEKIEAKIYQLAEAVAEDAAKIVLEKRRIRVTVRVRKRALPGIEYAAVEIQRP